MLSVELSALLLARARMVAFGNVELCAMRNVEC